MIKQESRKPQALPIAYCPLPIVYCPLPIAYCLAFAFTHAVT
jgi:hypothetical protein